LYEVLKNEAVRMISEQRKWTTRKL